MSVYLRDKDLLRNISDCIKQWFPKIAIPPPRGASAGGINIGDMSSSTRTIKGAVRTKEKPKNVSTKTFFYYTKKQISCIVAKITYIMFQRGYTKKSR